MNTTTPAVSGTPRTPAFTRARTMKAVVDAAATPGAEIRDVPVPTPGAGQLLLRVLRAGVCGTDLHIVMWVRWSQGRIQPPVSIGHVSVYAVYELGAWYSDFRLVALSR